MSYKDFEDKYPDYIIIQKEGFFYSAHNDSADVLGNVMEYRVGIDYFQRSSTGGPDIDKIIRFLKADDISFVVIEDGNVIEQHTGRNPFDGFIRPERRTEQDDKYARNHSSRSEKQPGPTYPDNLLIEIFQNDIDPETGAFPDFPDDVEERIDTLLEHFGTRKKDIVLKKYRDHKTLRGIGAEFDITGERIRQVINKTVKRMCHPSNKKYLLSENAQLEYGKTHKDIEHRAPVSSQTIEIGQFEYSGSPIAISEIANRINKLRDETWQRNLSYKDIAVWLIIESYLQETAPPDNLRRRPTDKGLAAGISVEPRVSQKGETYQVVVYNTDAQKIITDNIKQICDFGSKM